METNPKMIHMLETATHKKEIIKIRIHLPMQGTQVQSLVREDSTFHRATKPEGHTTELKLVSPCATTIEVCAVWGP